MHAEMVINCKSFRFMWFHIYFWIQWQNSSTLWRLHFFVKMITEFTHEKVASKLDDCEGHAFGWSFVMYDIGTKLVMGFTGTSLLLNECLHWNSILWSARSPCQIFWVSYLVWIKSIKLLSEAKIKKKSHFLGSKESFRS